MEPRSSARPLDRACSVRSAGRESGHIVLRRDGQAEAHAARDGRQRRREHPGVLGALVQPERVRPGGIERAGIGEVLAQLPRLAGQEDADLQHDAGRTVREPPAGPTGSRRIKAAGSGR